MLTYNMDVTPESVWKRTTPSEAELAQPYYCTEAGVFYAQQHFSTARTDKESYILFYTLRGHIHVISQHFPVPHFLCSV